MKRAIVAIAGLALLTALSASAQSMTTNRFKVAFAFMAGEKTMPAGEYRVKVNLDTKMVTLFGPAGAVASMLSMDEVDGSEIDGMQLQQFGETWVLEKVWVHGYAEKLFPGKLERKLAKLNPLGRQALIASSEAIR